MPVLKKAFANYSINQNQCHSRQLGCEGITWPLFDALTWNIDSVSHSGVA